MSQINWHTENVRGSLASPALATYYNKWERSATSAAVLTRSREKKERPRKSIVGKYGKSDVFIQLMERICLANCFLHIGS